MRNDLADPQSLPGFAHERFATIMIATEGAAPEEHALKIEELLRGHDGIQRVQADPVNARVIVTFDPRKTHAPEIHESILRSGYKASPTA